MDPDGLRREAGLVSTGSTIVCAVDGSEGGLAAVRVAADLAERLDRPLVGAHAVLPIPLTAAGIPHALPPPAEGATKRYESAAAARAREVLDDAGAGDARLRAAVGQVADVLLRVADDEDALMLVLETSKHGPLRSLLLGSVTDTLLRAVERPLLLVPADTERVASGPVVAAVGGRRDAAWIRTAELVALAGRGHLLLAHVVEDDAADDDPALAEAQSRVEAFDPALRSLGPTEALIETRIGFGEAGERLVALARASDASMIVTGSHDHGRLRAALVGSTVRTLIRGAGVPTLVCPGRSSVAGPRSSSATRTESPP
jgi:nucleotide-binding universal stress UspA family protein